MLFRLSNNLEFPNHTSILDLFLTDVVLSRIPPGAVISMEDPTIAAITDKLFQRALSREDDDLNMTKALFRLPLDINRPVAVGSRYQMPLQAAIGRGALELKKLLIAAGADVNTTFGNQTLLLIQSAENKECHLALRLCDTLISTHSLANEEMQLNSALLSTTSRCNIDLVKLLIRREASADHCVIADVKAPFSEITVLVQALYNREDTLGRPRRTSWEPLRGRPEDNLGTDEKRLQLAKYLLELSCEDGRLPSIIPAARIIPDALFAACLSANIIAIEFLHNHRADINVCNAKGLSPLRAAVLSGDPRVLALIYRLGANLDELINPELGERLPLLYCAVARGNVSLLQLLFQFGVKIERITSLTSGKRPSLLHVAAIIDCTSTIDLLIERGIDVNSSINLSSGDDWATNSQHYYRIMPQLPTEDCGLPGKLCK